MFAVEVHPATATALEPGPFVHAADTASVPITGNELDDPVPVLFGTVDYVAKPVAVDVPSPNESSPSR